MTIRTLSSRQTIFAKFVFAPFWFVLFGAATLSMFTSNNGLGRAPGGSPSTRWVFLVIWLGGTLALLWLGSRLKRVRMDDEALYVSNFRTEFRVQLQDVERVAEGRWLRMRPVTIEHRSTTIESARFTFMPSQGYWASRGPHPVVQEIAEAVRRAGGGDLAA